MVSLRVQPTDGLVSNVNMNSHHVIFDNLGQISTGVTYINVAIPLNISIAFKQIGLFEEFLSSIINSAPTTNTSTSTSNHSSINKQNIETLFKQIVSYTRNRLWTLRKQLTSIDDLLPADVTFDRTNERHKRLVFLAPMIVCEVDRTWYKQNISDQQTIIADIQEELDFYKLEYGKLYNETLPDLIPTYVDENYYELDMPTMNMHVDYLERTRRDVKFLMNIIEQQNFKLKTSHSNFNSSKIYNPKVFVKTTTTTTTPAPTTTPTPAPTTTYSPPWFQEYLANITAVKRKEAAAENRRRTIRVINAWGKVWTASTPSTTTTTRQYIPPHLRLLGITEIIDGDARTSSPPPSSSLEPLIPDSTTPQNNWHSFVQMPAPVFLNRTKRFIVEAAFATGVLGTFLGLFNTYEMEKIRSSMSKLEDAHNLLVQVSETQQHQIRGLEIGLEHLNDVFTLLIKNSPTLLYAKINDQLLALQDNIADLKDTLQMLQLQKLSTSLLTATQLTNIYSEITSLAQINKLQPLTSKPQDLYQLETSYLRIKNELLIVVHVPCSNPANLLTIYRYVPFPIPVLPKHSYKTFDDIDTIQDIFDLQNPARGSNSPSTPTEGIHFTTNTNSDLIAIGKNSNGKNRYLLLSSPDLNSCTKRSQAYICERHQVTRSDLLGSCLGSLYMQSAVGVQANCLIGRVSLQEQVYQISNTDHIVYTPIPITTQIACNNGSYFNLKIKNTKQIHIPEGCSVDLTNHTITSDFNIRTTATSVHFEWDFDPLSLPNSAELMVDAKTMDFRMDQIKLSLAMVKNKSLTDAQFDKLIVNHYGSGSWVSVLMLTLLSIAVLVALTTMTFCCRNFLLSRGWNVRDKKEAIIKATYRRGYGSEDEDESEVFRSPRSETPPPGLAHAESRSTTT